MLYLSLFLLAVQILILAVGIIYHFKDDHDKSQTFLYTAIFLAVPVFIISLFT